MNPILEASPGGPPGTAQLLAQVQRAYSGGATGAQLQALAQAIARLSGVPLPAGGGVAAVSEYVLDWHNFARWASAGGRAGRRASAAAARAASSPPPRRRARRRRARRRRSGRRRRAEATAAGSARRRR